MRCTECSGGPHLLYVGKTGRVGQRFGDHSAKRWFPQVTAITLEWFPTEAAAAVTERRVIADERPRYNLARPRKVASGRKRTIGVVRAAGQIENHGLSCEDLALAAETRHALADGTALAARKAAGARQADIAGSIGVSRSAVGHWETGAAVPSAEHALAYGRLLARLGKAA